MGAPSNDTGESIHAKRLAAIENRYEDGVAARPCFKQRFCWVLIGLIIAIAVLMALVVIAVLGC